MLGLLASSLTLSKYCVGTSSTLKDIGPPVVYLFNVTRIANIGLGNIEGMLRLKLSVLLTKSLALPL